jgi:Mn-dependent DtxR family transcriptional regulator
MNAVKSMVYADTIDLLLSLSYGPLNFNDLTHKTPASRSSYKKILDEFQYAGFVKKNSGEYELTSRGTRMAICLLGVYGKTFNKPAEHRQLIATLNYKIYGNVPA